MRLIVGVLLLACAGAVAFRDVIASLGRSVLAVLMPQGGPADRPEPHRLDPALAAAAAMMIAPPYGTPLALQIDPRRLRSIMERGESQYRSAAVESEQLDGARLIQIAAALGFGPARRLAVQDYPRSRLMRSAVSAPDFVRYGLDDFVTDAAKEPEQALANIAGYFVRRNELQTFSTHLIEAIRDDARLHAEKRLGPLLASLMKIDGACAPLARAIAAGRTGDGAGCPPDLMRSVLAHVRKFGAVEYDANARRRALWALDHLGLTAQSGEPPRTPAVRVVPGSTPVWSSPN
jgi:hypothetical protein